MSAGLHTTEIMLLQHIHVVEDLAELRSVLFGLGVGQLVAEIPCWRAGLLGGGLIEEQILSANATGGRVGDEALPESMLAMVSEGVPKDLGTSTIEVSSGQMVLVDGEGTRTVCTR